jgi:hypothetical protein
VEEGILLSSNVLEIDCIDGVILLSRIKLVIDGGILLSSNVLEIACILLSWIEGVFINRYDGVRKLGIYN